MSPSNCRRCDRETFILITIDKDDRGLEIDRIERDCRVGEKGYCTDCIDKRLAELRRQDTATIRSRRAKNLRNTDSSDCTLIAVQAAGVRSRAKIEKIARKFGWKPNGGKGLPIWNYREMAELAGLNVQAYSDDVGAILAGEIPSTLRELLNKGEQGTFLLTVQYKTGGAHAICVKDGTAYNYGSACLDADIVAIWRVV